MKKIKWYIPDKNIYKCIKVFDKLLNPSCIIKENQKRTIYRIHLDNCVFYIKHDHPKQLRHIIKSILIPKAKLEFRSAMVLKNAGIPTIPVLGWGRRGFDSFLITKEIPDTKPLKDILSSFYQSKKDMNIFLTHISQFLRLLVEKNVIHPDFHPGNIIVKKDKNKFSFYLIDLHRVRVADKLDKKDKFRLFGWLVTMLWPFDWKEIEEFLISSKFCEKKAGIKEKWHSLIRWRLKYIKSRCKKRKKKLFQDSSICRAYNLVNSKLIIKKDFEIKDIKEAYLVRFLSNNDAQKSWLNAYFLDLFGIPVAKHYAWLSSKDKSMLLIERPNAIKLSEFFDKEDSKMALRAINKLNEWCNIADIDISFNPEDVYVKNSDVFPLIFTGAERFSFNF